jgi:hypothetical protein
MEILIKISQFLQALSSKQFKQYLALAIGLVLALTCGLFFYIYSTCNALITQIKSIESLSKKSVNLLKEYKNFQENTRKVQDIIDQNREFDIKIYFEKLCKDQNVNPEQGWGDVKSQDINDQIKEVTLSATLKGQTTEKLVSFLDALGKSPMIQIKVLNVKKEENKKISFAVTLSTKFMKKGLDVKSL